MIITVSTRALANTIIKKAFEDEYKINPQILHSLMFEIYVACLQESNKKLINEEFFINRKGFFLYSLKNKFTTDIRGNIKRFLKNEKGEVFIVDEIKILEIINDCWESYKYNTSKIGD